MYNLYSSIGELQRFKYNMYRCTKYVSLFYEYMLLCRSENVMFLYKVYVSLQMEKKFYSKFSTFLYGSGFAWIGVPYVHDSGHQTKAISCLLWRATPTSTGQVSTTLHHKLSLSCCLWTHSHSKVHVTADSKRIITLHECQATFETAMVIRN